MKYFSLILVVFFCLVSCEKNEILDGSEILVYPNPFSNNFNLRVSVIKESSIAIYIYNEQNETKMLSTVINGDFENSNTLNKSVTKEYVIDLSDWSKGNYEMDVVINDVVNRINLIKI